MRYVQHSAIIVALVASTSGAPASETSSNASTDPGAFVSAMGGTWAGRGTVLPSFEQETPFRVTCEFDVSDDGSAFVIDGECGALFVKRRINVTLEDEDGVINGTYEAELRTGTALLSGTRDGPTIDLDVTWGGEVNGDTEGTMKIERTGDDALRIVFRDMNPATGQDEITSEFELERS